MFKFGTLEMTWCCPVCDVLWLGVCAPDTCHECDCPGEDFEHALELESRQFCPVVGVQ